MTKTLFIDSQIWLGLYFSSPNDLKAFKSLESMASKNNFKIVTTNQVMDEVRRNRYSSIYKNNKGIKNSLLKHTNININIPNFFKEFKDEINTFNNAEKALNDAIHDLNKKAEEKANTFELEADKIIKKLLFCINKEDIYDTNEVYEKALTRMNIGNPPGKDGSYGDALNWESLLKNAQGEVFLISSDKDYWNDPKKGVPNNFLMHEWENKKNSNLYMYSNIKEFFDKNIPDLKIKNAQIIESTINDLKYSPNYATTHAAIKKLTDYINTFDDENKINILTAYMFNSQVNNIMHDSDINEFFKIVFTIDPSNESIENELNILTKETNLFKIKSNYLDY